MPAMPRRVSLRVLAVALPALVLMTAAFKVGEHVGQPHMVAAKTALISAQKHLTEAEPDKGGHREKAMDLVKQAIDEVQAGIDYAKHH
jgi:hypothetical protein